MESRDLLLRVLNVAALRPPSGLKIKVHTFTDIETLEAILFVLPDVEKRPERAVSAGSVTDLPN